MARETKVGLIVGLGVILFVSVFVSDYISVPQHQEELAEEGLSNFVDQTTNQTELVLTRGDEERVGPVLTDPRDLAAAVLERQEDGRGYPVYQDAEVPPRREVGGLTDRIDDRTPVARDPEVIGGPIGRRAIHDPGLAQSRQLDVNEREAPGRDRLTDVRVDIPEISPQLINAQPTVVKHMVASGETLTSIARKHYDGDGNLWRSIRDANPGKVGANGEVNKGVVLIIPKRSTEADDPAGELIDVATGTTNGDRPQRQRVRMVTVKEGETLSELAAEHLGSGGKWQLIMDVNTDVLEKPEHLRAGMKLRIPVQETVELIEAANEALAERESADDRRETRPTEQVTAKTYTVKEGDSLYRIAEQLLGNGDRYNEIYEANKNKLSSPGAIRVGMTLKLPSR